MSWDSSMLDSVLHFPQTRTDSPRRDRSSSPMDMETSDEEEEDGQIDKYDLYDDKDRRSTSRANHDDEPVTLTELRKVVLTRDQIAKHYLTPWFEDLVKGYILAVFKFVS